MQTAQPRTEVWLGMTHNLIAAQCERPHLRGLWWTLGIVMLVLITVLSIMPLRGTGIDLPNGDKLLHAFAYIVLSTYFGQLLGNGVQARIQLVAGLLAYGVMIELLQWQMPPRSAEWADLGANLCGIVFGLMLLRTPVRGFMLCIDRRLRRG